MSANDLAFSCERINRNQNVMMVLGACDCCYALSVLTRIGMQESPNARERVITREAVALRNSERMFCRRQLNPGS